MVASRRRTVALVAGWVLLALSFFPLVMTLLGLNVAPREAVTGAGCIGDPACNDEVAAYMMAGIGAVLLLATLGGGSALLRRAQPRAAGAMVTAFGGISAYITVQTVTDTVGDDDLRVVSISLLALLTVLLLGTGVVMQLSGRRRAPAPAA
jgi:hypothetical protein